MEASISSSTIVIALADNEIASVCLHSGSLNPQVIIRSEAKLNNNQVDLYVSDPDLRTT